jgi:hypothetical protein
MDRLIFRLVALLLAIVVPRAAFADALTLVRSVTVISDDMSNAKPRVFAGSVVDYKIAVSNPVGNLTTPVKNVVIVENIPAGGDLQVTDIAAAGKGPVEFLDGSLLGTGLASSGLTYTYNPAVVDSIEFYDGTAWVSNAAATSGNYNPGIRAIRVTLAGTFVTSTTFQLRYRVRVR